MAGLNRIVAATDFSQDAGYAVARAGALALEHDAGLEVLHVVDASLLDSLKAVFSDRPAIEQHLYAATQQALDEVAAGLGRSGVRVSAALRVGSVVEALLEACGDADLLVLGAHGMNLLRDRILGTTAERLLGRSRVPIAVVRSEAPGPYRRALVAVDLSGYSAPALATAARIAPRAELHAFHVYDVPFEGKLWLAGVPDATIEKHRGDMYARAVRDLEALVARVTQATTPVITLVRGKPALSILDAAARYRPDLIVLGRQGRSAVSEFLLGSVTRHVLADAECDVLIVPTGGAPDSA